MAAGDPPLPRRWGGTYDMVGAPRSEPREFGRFWLGDVRRTEHFSTTCVCAKRYAAVGTIFGKGTASRGSSNSNNPDALPTNLLFVSNCNWFVVRLGRGKRRQRIYNQRA